MTGSTLGLKTGSRRGKRPLSTAYATRPINSPQNAPPIPNKVMLAAATRKVISEASRDCIGHGTGQAAADGAQQGEPGQVVMKVAGKGHEHRSEGHAEDPYEDVEDARSNAGDPAPGGFFMGLLAGADGCCNRRNVERRGNQKGAMSKEPNPVRVTIGLALVLNPSLHPVPAIPGMY